MIPAIGFMIAAYTVARLANTAVFTKDDHRLVRQWLALLAIGVIIWMAIEINSLAVDPDPFSGL